MHISFTSFCPPYTPLIPLLEGYVGAIYIFCIFVEIQLQTKGNEIVSRTGGKMNTCINIIYLIEDTKI